MKRIYLFLILIFLSVSIYAGRGIYGEEQKGLLEACKSWMVGDEIPEYLIENSSKFNPMSIYKPTSYIAKIDNKDLLISIAISRNTPAYSRKIAISGLRRLLNPTDFREKFLSFESNVTEENLGQFKKDKKVISAKCNWVHSYFVDSEDLSKYEAYEVLRSIRSAPSRNLSFHEQYKKLADKYSYRKEPVKYPNFYVTKVGNGGDFHICQEDRPVLFPDYKIHIFPEKLLTILVSMEKGGAYIYRAKINAQDQKARERYGDRVSTNTNDRIMLFVVKESINALN